MANEQVNRVTRSLVCGSLTIGGTVQTVLSDYVVTVQKTIPGSTVVQIDVPLSLATVLGMGMECDNDCTVETNTHGIGAQDTLTMKAKQPLIWVTGDPDNLKFLSGNVTSFYVTTGLAPVLFRFGAAIDATPGLLG